MIVDERFVTYINSLNTGNTPFLEELEKTAKEHAPWYVIPADKKYFARVAIGSIILEKLQSLNLSFPSGKSENVLAEAREQLLREE